MKNLNISEQTLIMLIRARMLTAMGLLNTKQQDIGSVLNARLGRSISKTERGYKDGDVKANDWDNWGACESG